MSTISRIGTALPTWGADRSRQAGDDEDAVTLAVAAGRMALGDVDLSTIRAVVFVSRDLPLLEGDHGAALLGGLDLADHVPVATVLGGAPAVLDAIACGGDGTLVIGSDTATGSGAGAGAVLCGAQGSTLDVTARVVRSLPVTSRDAAGNTVEYADPRLLRERGVNESLSRLGHPKPIAVAGLAEREAAPICADAPPVVPTTGASSVGFALAALVERGIGGPVLAVEQATLALGELGTGQVAVARDEPAPRPRPTAVRAPGPSVSLSLAAYERAFEPKLRLAAARCITCGTLSYPPRHRCIQCGAQGGLGVSTDLVPLTRRGTVYSVATIHVPVPGLISPYTVVIVELDGTGVRTLVQQTGAMPASAQIGDAGSLVFRLVAVRQGVPDYGYAFFPDRATLADPKQVA